MNETHFFSQEIMKSGDIRGVIGEELFYEDAYFIGRSFGTIMMHRGKRSCAVGYDGRLSSPELSTQLLRGLTDSGIDAVVLGLIPSPVLYFAVSQYGYHCGIVITASHNPAEYNGFKFITDEGPYHGDDIQKLALVCKEADYSTGKGSVSHRNIISDYIEYIVSFLKLPFKKELSVVWDPGNGASAAVIHHFIRNIPGKNILICGEVDGTFPNHHPDPSIRENVVMLQKAVSESGADLGIAFDGDGDRLGVVDSEGYLLFGDQLLTVFARDFLKDNPGEKVMSEVKASRFFYDDILSNGGQPVMWKVGHSNQKEKMKADHICLAGETSGHIYFKENRGFDDALFASVKLLNILSNSEKSLTEMRKEFPVYQDSGEIRIPLDKEESARMLEKISIRLISEGRDFNDIDGIRVPCSDGFWIMRSSNTQPHITIRCEAVSREGLDECFREIEEYLAYTGNPGLLGEIN